MTKQISLTQGKFALVDDEDYDELNKHKWFALKSRKTFYASRKTHNGKRTTVMMHRQILGLVPGDGKITDHRNRDGLDNRRSNLRIVNHAINNHNHGGHSHNSSGHNGVHWDTQANKWRARIMVGGKQIHLGYHNEIKDAVEARRLGELKYWGEER